LANKSALRLRLGETGVPKSRGVRIQTPPAPSEWKDKRPDGGASSGLLAKDVVVCCGQPISSTQLVCLAATLFGAVAMVVVTLVGSFSRETLVESVPFGRSLNVTAILFASTPLFSTYAPHRPHPHPPPIPHNGSIADALAPSLVHCRCRAVSALLSSSASVLSAALLSAALGVSRAGSHAQRGLLGGDGSLEPRGAHRLC
jgi:hypothetical protein